MSPDVSPDQILSIAHLDWFQRPELRAVFSALNRKGHEARIVGGALRNTLMGLPISDVDFATTAEPDEVTQAAEKAGLKVIPTGLGHGTVTLISDRVPFEVTTLRHDVETDGRFAKVAFTRDWAADAARRDFTINALYANADGIVYDPLGQGIADIEKRRVRFIGCASDRIREDYLRILRFFRFTADYSLTLPDPEGLVACIEGRAGLAMLSAERIRTEILRILTTRQPQFALDPMIETGLLVALLGGVTQRCAFEHLAALEAALTVQSKPIRRLAALAVTVTEDAERLSGRLRLSNAESARLLAIAELEPVLNSETDEKTARAALYRLGTDVYQDRVLIAWSRIGAADKNKAWRALFDLPDRWQPPAFPVTGKDLLAQGYMAGPKLGETLRGLEERWIASDFSLGRDDLLKQL